MTAGALEISQPGVAGSIRSAERRPLGVVGAGHVLREWSVWRARARDHRAWWNADDHVLRDCGLSRKEVIRDVPKPCWRK